MTENLEQFVASEGPRIEGALLEAVGRLEGAVGAAALYAVRAGGKRVRPLLVVAAYRAAGGDGATDGAMYRIGAAVELIHTYSLLHDDLPAMDDDPLRRGLPTAHRVFGVPVVAEAGAALQQLAFLELARAGTAAGGSPARLAGLVRRLSRAAGVEGMVGGQFLDLAAEGRTLTPVELEALHRGKTAALIAAACALGGAAAEASEETIDALARYGAHLGLAFQIVDDLLDVVGDPARTGKASGADAARAKSTYPAVFGAPRARELAQAAGNAARDQLTAFERRAVLDGFVDFVMGRLG
ncbi:MAG: polyprenyl synthetase family protein [Gemmatimonadota bacterium]